LSTWFTRRFVALLGLEQSSFTSWNLLFSRMGPRWAGSGSEPWGPQPTPWPTAAPGGEKREGGALHRPYTYTWCKVQGASTSAVGGRLPALLGARFGGLRAAPFGPPSSLATGTAPASRAWSWWTWTWSRRAGSSGSAVRVHRAANKGALKRPKARQLRRGLLALGPAGIPEPRPLLQRAASS
jgi:hypothetical protein